MKKKTLWTSRLLILCTCAIILTGALAYPAKEAHAFNFTSTEPRATQAPKKEPTPAPTANTSATGAPAATDPTAPAATAGVVVSTEGTTQDPVLEPRYGRTNIKGVNVRQKASVKAEVVHRAHLTGTVFEILEEKVLDNGDVWYQVLIEKEKGYIRSDLVELIDEATYNFEMSKVEEDEGETVG